MRRPWLLVFSPVYWLITSIRNAFFDLGILPSASFAVPVISVGNLSVGGTGKTPHVEWLVELYKPNYRVAVLSRGYGRRTRGFIRADQSSTAAEIGDEPMQIFLRFPDITVAVCEKRTIGIQALLAETEAPEIIILDDAFQHRYVVPALSWILTRYDIPYSRDYILPGGNLREDIRGAERADVITVTKCPDDLDTNNREALWDELNPEPTQLLFFSRFHYAKLVNAHNETVEKPKRALLVTGIAYSDNLLEYLTAQGIECLSLKFRDHRNFTHADIEKMTSAYHDSGASSIITTRKDYVRWPINDEKLRDIPIHIQDINVDFGSEEAVVKRYFERFIEEFDPEFADR